MQEILCNSKQGQCNKSVNVLYISKSGLKMYEKLTAIPDFHKRLLDLNKPRTFAQCRAGAAANISQLTHTKLTQLGL